MARANARTRSELAAVFIWLSLGFAGTACVAKPSFQCQSDESCVRRDGIRGTCEASGECSFKSALGNPGGAGGVAGGSASSAGSTSSADGPSNGGTAGDGSPGEAGALGDAGASCMDETEGDCYRCSPKTSVQFLNACTRSRCVPFDDHARLTNLTASGELPPLPPAAGQ